jgi:hypothetical protein
MPLSLVNALPTPDGRRVAGAGNGDTVEAWQTPTSFSSPKLTATCAPRRATPSGGSLPALGLSWSERQWTTDDELRDRYAEEIPVVLVDGIQRDFWKIDEARLERVLRRAIAGD